tara:strand:- start:3669 stop:3872 length:204 start_codon:yes stop_codon:yes gene_type:complete
MIYLLLLFIILIAIFVFKVLPTLSKKVSEFEQKAMKQKLIDNNESNKYGVLIVIIVLLIFFVVALVS